MTMEDDLPDALTEQDAAKARFESNTMFGYMDHGTKSLIFRRAVGIVFGQFLTFMTAKKNQYLLSKNQYLDGYWKHMENENGEKLYWITNEHGQRVLTTQVTDEPCVDWYGLTTQGIMWTLYDLAKYSFTDHKKLAEVWANPNNRENLIIFIEDMFIVAILSWLISSMLQDEPNVYSMNFSDRSMYRILNNMRRDINPI